MKMERSALWLGLSCVMLLGACGDAGEKGPRGASCTVSTDVDNSVTIRCDDGTNSTLRPPSAGDGGSESCSVISDAETVVITCPDGSSASFPAQQAMDAGPGADAGSDGGNGSCKVQQAGDGTVTITCPDGSNATIPGTKSAASGKIGATTASCGTCHDNDQAKAHFAAMTVEQAAGPQETCGTCHRETSIEPVSGVHLRADRAQPGLKVEILEAKILPNDDAQSPRKPSVRLKLSYAGAPVTRDGMSFDFLIAKVLTTKPVGLNEALPDRTTPVPTIAAAYQSYLLQTVEQKDTPAYPLNGKTPRKIVQAKTEKATGTFSAVVGSTGVYDYTFKDPLPVGYDASATHLVALFATRTVDGTRFVANAERFFVPNDAQATPLVRDVVRTETCNKCHNPLSAHGGARQDVQLCLTCHSQGSQDPESGNSIDLNVMVHKIHMGKDLPSVKAGTKYSIVGYGLSEIDFSDVGYPQPVENCQSCHTANDGDRWITNGTRAACVSCHDQIYKPAAEGGHKPFALNEQQPSDCGNFTCHASAAEGGNSPNALTAHITSLNDPEAPVFKLDIVSASVIDADSPPELRIRARVGKRSTPDANLTPVLSPDHLQTLNVFLNGPNTGFLLNGNNIVQVSKASLVGLAADGAHPGELTFALPKSLRELVGTAGNPDTDSYTIGIRAVYDPTPAGAPDNDRVDMQRNPVAALTAGDELVNRRQVADTDKCNSCHGELSGHGGGILAKNVEECVMCHTGTLDTRVRQGANKVAGPTTSLRFSTLIHRVHGGSIATAPYSVYGFGTKAPYPQVDFSEVPFPGDVRDCTTCHAPGTYFLPLPEGDPPTQTAVLDANGNVVGP